MRYKTLVKVLNVFVTCGVKADNAIQCMDCSKWIHKRCSGYMGILREGLQYQCPRCSSKILNIVAPDEIIEINFGDDKIECVQKFCY